MFADVDSVAAGARDFPFDCVWVTMVGSNAVTRLEAGIVTKKTKKKISINHQRSSDSGHLIITSIWTIGV